MLALKKQFDKKKQDWLDQNFRLRQLQRLDTIHAEPFVLLFSQEEYKRKVCAQDGQLHVGVCMNGSSHSNVNLSAWLRRSWGFPVVPTVDLYAFSRFALLRQSSNFMWKWGIFGIDKFCSIYIRGIEFYVHI